MNPVNAIIILLMGLASIVIGIYVGFWVMFVGGISDVLAAFGAETISFLDLGLGFLKIYFALDVGLIMFSLCSMATSFYIAAVYGEVKR